MKTIRRQTGVLRSSREGGVAAVEFAFLLPLLLVVLFGIVNFGVYFYDKAVVTNATREGARAGIVAAVSGNGFNGSGCTAVTDGTLSNGADTGRCVAQNYLNNKLVTFGTPNLTVTSANTPSTCTAPNVGTNACTLTVTVTYAYASVGYFDLLLPAVTATTVMYY